MEKFQKLPSRKGVLTVIKYLIYIALMFLTTMAKTSGGLKPFGIGLFVGLVFSRQNLIVLAPAYIAACFHAEPTWQSLVAGATPAVIFTVAYFAHHMTKKRMGLTAAAIYTALSQVPYLIFQILAGRYYEGILTVILAEFFAYVAMLAMFAVIGRGVKYRPASDESIALLIFSGVLFLCLYNIGYQDFKLFYLFYGFALLTAAYTAGAAVPLYIGVVAGLACALTAGEIEIIAVCVIVAAAAAAFRNLGIASSAAASSASCLFCAYCFDGLYSFGYLNVIAYVVGAATFALIPRQYKSALAAPVGGFHYARAGKTVINKNRRELSVRLYSLAGIFEDIRALLEGEAGILPDAVPSNRTLAKDIAIGFCGKCENCESCFSALAGDTSDIITDIVAAAERKGKASIIDMPPFITSRCRRINGLIQEINEKNERRENIVDNARECDRSRQLLAVQMGGVAEILDNLADEYKKSVSFDTPREKRIMDELTYHSVDCKEILVYGEGGSVNVTALIATKDAEKTVILTVISHVLKVRLIRTSCFDSDDGYVCMQFAPAPKYNFVYGEYGRKKEGSAVSGDARCVRRVTPSRVIFAVSDGMGSGEEAEQAGLRAVQTVEGFFEAGFSADCALALTNRLLSLKGGDGFSALDLMVLDLNSGACDIIKLGAAYSALKHKENIEIIEGSALPVGALDEVKPSVTRSILLNNDLAVIMSDGVADVLSPAEITDYLTACKGINPQAIAEELTVAALNNGANDDLTVMAVRIFARE